MTYEAKVLLFLCVCDNKAGNCDKAEIIEKKSFLEEQSLQISCDTQDSGSLLMISLSISSS